MSAWWLLLTLLLATPAVAEPISIIGGQVEYPFTHADVADVVRGYDVHLVETCSDNFLALATGVAVRHELTGSATCSTGGLGVSVTPSFTETGPPGGGLPSYVAYYAAPTLGPAAASTIFPFQYFTAGGPTGSGCTVGTNCIPITDLYVLRNGAYGIATNNNWFLFSQKSGGSTFKSYLDHGMRLGGTAVGATSGYYLDVAGGDALFSGHIDYTGAAAMTTGANVSACGTLPAIGTLSYDASGTVTVGTIATTCTITFQTAYAQTPRCFANDQSAVLQVRAVPSTTAVVFTTLVAADISSDVIDWHCDGKK